MKEKIKRISSSTWALILALMMVVSSFSVLAATTNVNKTKAIGTITVYFKNTVKWSNVYAYFYNSSYWNESKGSGSQGIAGGPCKMSKVDGTDDIYSYTYTGNYSQYIAFTKDEESNYGNFWSTEAVYRDDFSTSKSMYTPNTTSSGTYNNNTVKYYNNGTWSTYSASKDPVATSVSLTSNATDGKIAQGKDLILSATAIGKVDGDVTYTFYNGSTQVGDAQTTTASTATTTVSGLSAGDYTFTVKVTKNGYTEVASVPINVTVTSGDGYFLYNGSSENEDLKNATSLGEFSGNTLSLDLDSNKTYYLFVVKDNNFGNSYLNSDKAFGSDNSVVLYDYDKNDYNHKIEFKPSTSGKYKFTWTPGNGQGTLKYELESTPVAKSVNLTANPENVVVGGSTTLTANVTELNIGASNVKYTFTEVDENGNAVGSAKEETTSTTTFDNLTEGKHYYKVTVSAEGYTSVTDTVEVNVNQPYNVTAKYEITDDGVTYTDKNSNKDIVSVDGEVTSNTSSGKVVAKDTITIGSSTYVFAGWESKNGSFTDATKSSTTFSPLADAVVIAQYKKQYTVSASTNGGNGTINVAEKAPYLAGDKVTININPKSGYQLKSLMRSTGIPSVPRDVTEAVSNNKYVVDKISSNETFVAEFEKNPLDCSKYLLVGDFDGGKWDVGSGLAFTSDGKAVITLTSSRKQFKFYNTDTKTYYGSKNTSNEVVRMGTEYTTYKGDGSTYRIDDTGTFIIEIVDIDSNGAPKFKVTKDDTISNYQLYISKGKNDAGKLLGNFTKAKDDGTYQYIITVDAGTHYFYIKDSSNTDSTLQYSDGRDNCELGTSYLMNRRNNVENIQYKLSAGSYKVTYCDIDTNGQGKFKIDSLSKPLADSVALSSSATAVKIGNKVTLTAKINNKHVEDGVLYLYFL